MTPRFAYRAFGIALVCLLSATSQLAEAAAGAPPAASEVGTVSTLAGPRFCQGSSVRDAASDEVGALAVDRSGSTYFETGRPQDGFVAWVEPDGVAQTMKTGVQRDRATGEKGDRAPFLGPGRLATYGPGGLFIAAGSKIMQIDYRELAGVLGDPNQSPGLYGPSSSGDGGPVAAARFTNTTSIATDQTGNLYIADEVDRKTGDFRIRFVNRSTEPILFYPGTPNQVSIAPGNIDSIAGVADGGAGGRVGGNNRSALRSHLRGLDPKITVVDGRLYVSIFRPAARPSSAKSTVGLINLGGGSIQAHGLDVASGELGYVAGRGPLGSQGDGGKAKSALISKLSGIAADGQGNLYLAEGDRHIVRKVDSTGRITRLAGTGRRGFNGNDRKARSAVLNSPYDIEAGPEGLFIADRANKQVRVVDGANTIRASRGSGVGTYWGCMKMNPSKAAGGTQQAAVGFPSSATEDPAGNIYFTSSGQSGIRKLRPDGTVVKLRASAVPVETPACTSKKCAAKLSAPGPISKALLRYPGQIRARLDGNLYLLDLETSSVRFLNLGKKPVRVNGTSVAPRSIATIAGKFVPPRDPAEQPPPIAERAPATKASFVTPTSFAVDSRGTLFVADSGRKRVFQINRRGSITTFAGQGATGSLLECCQDPVALAPDSTGNLYVADIGRDSSALRNDHPRLWFINRGKASILSRGQKAPPGQAILLAGNGGVGFGGEGGPALKAELLLPGAIAVSSRNELYLTQLADPTEMSNVGYIRRIDSSGIINTVAGNGVVGFNGDGLRAKLTSLAPSDISFDRCGNLLLADSFNDRVRRLNLRNC